ncbi:hypothetical protein A2641_03685 [Candidatus Nomurabacteria bacterium RIFCSPHIGHO2_01_FULL_37_25]|uniref:Uncharacterized protein n=1 Tax=Candidatus Nomurabacteria bacterium RIFCSPLOWO2_01_FULL_36_16 TaxID=1801767 RepID=A0A1F6WY20_9BACT|nr:MAG: hypothetical protein A2641_03685 [Candidatus Nomurabacteria bacterium RIFCSPHIGHO2_01_FULL_37_25]OGI75136.1 MAG: hypothetical protein A3D36_00840 [Candidatus Nomurabacteria bacterium RIFCSPHIGHO2_02_FULL_36_29]OGI86791.1 MAG: hypothetical protein A3A91_01050 [Candidatus Nomurabacteria bacterium RIFCSPLOWO2_01_FULL_36_16]OGI95273.1 MAG: hypothetical protein A3I84_01610 [Candidatus Nomurabacteria bacterium RIFCSPLOWO2_02_FULL_36_8]
MVYENKKKICQNCKQEFTIEPEDFNFYEKIKVPEPTFCPECRMIRRMTWRNERSLFKRPCDKTGKQIISMFHPEAKVVVYDHDIWWSDQWEPTDYGKDYNFNRPFFEQFKELLSQVPLANLGNSNSVGSPYGNHNADCKDCYLLYASFGSERTHYSYGAVHLKDCMDMYTCLDSELCYEDIVSADLYKTHFSYDADESLNCFFLKYSKNMQDSIGCINLRNKKRCILNVEYSKEEYEKRKKELDFGSYRTLSQFENTFHQFVLNFPYRYAHTMKSLNVTGDNIINSKNAKNCFDLYGGAEDVKYVTHFVEGKDSYDLYGGGAGASLMYEGVDVGIQASKELFAVFTHGCLETYYTYMCYSSKNLFGCIGMRGKQYCILNKQYTKEEYFKLVPKIIEQMNTVPYFDKKGITYKYGEFFPSELSPFTYNETIAQEYFPKEKEEIIRNGYSYRASLEKDYQTTIESDDLPDHIKDVSEAITEEVIACPNNGSVLTQCAKAYRIIKSELDFLKNNNIALPRYCPNCRHYKRLKQRNPFKLWHAKCQCFGSNYKNEKYKNTVEHIHGDEPCPNEFETSYAPDRPEIIYCEKCYQQEVY